MVPSQATPTPMPETRTFSKLLREPTVHFFALASVALLAHRLIVGNPRTIEITPALKADLLRRYHDQLGRPASPTEARAVITNWKADEVLYREALREGVDREDSSVRNLLISKMRDRLLLQTRIPDPTDADLAQFLEQHRRDFEAPLLYEHEFVAFSKEDPRAEAERAKYRQKLATGATPASLGLRSTVANVSRERIEQDLGPGLAEQVARLPQGEWQALEAPDRLLLVKLNRIQGGLPEPAALREQLEAGWRTSFAQAALDRATQELAKRYQFQDER